MGGQQCWRLPMMINLMAPSLSCHFLYFLEQIGNPVCQKDVTATCTKKYYASQRGFGSHIDKEKHFPVPVEYPSYLWTLTQWMTDLKGRSSNLESPYCVYSFDKNNCRQCLVPSLVVRIGASWDTWWQSWTTLPLKEQSWSRSKPIFSTAHLLHGLRMTSSCK